jgi:hypothetical protein
MDACELVLLSPFGRKFEGGLTIGGTGQVKESRYHPNCECN